MASELMARGRESAAALEALLRGALTTSCPAPAPYGDLRELAAQILRCCDCALAALHSVAEGPVDAAGHDFSIRKRGSPSGAAAQARPRRRLRASGAEVPARVQQRRTLEDGFQWRKYGQKDIHNCKHPRTYHRCTYKLDNGCPATRQVQQSEDDPSLYVVTYFGEHTCTKDSAAAVADDEKTRQVVINFGSGSASNSNVRSEASQLPHAPWLPEEGKEQSANVVCKVEPVPSSSFSCASPDLEPLLRYFDSDYFCESDIPDEFVYFNEISILQQQ